MYRLTNPIRGAARVGACVTALFTASAARGAGIEDVVGGTVGLGRAANHGRVNDFMAVLQNPANLAIAPNSNIGGELRVPLLRACYDRARDPSVEYRRSSAGETLESFDEVCNGSGLSPTANIGYVHGASGKWGLGIGLYTPAAVGNTKFGDDTIRTLFPATDEPGRPTNEGLESPTRQLGLKREGATAHLLAGFALRPIAALRFGASAGVGFAQVYNKTVSSSLGGTFNDQEVLIELRVRDRAIPRAVAGVVLTLTRGLDLFATAQYQGSIDARGRMELTANGLKDVPLRPCGSERPGSHCFIDGARLRVPFPTWETTFGVRYAKLRGAAEYSERALRDERWDIEVDVNWSQTSAVDRFRLDVHDIPSMSADPLAPRIQFGNTELASTSFVRYGSGVDKKWRDTWTIRAGGDVNVIPERLALRMGGSFATAAVDPSYMNIDYWPVRKFSGHVGLTFGMDYFDVHVAYAHVFYQTVIVPVGAGLVKEIATSNEAMADAVNEGTFSAGQDIVSLQINASF